MKFLRLQPLVSLAWSVIRNVRCENKEEVDVVSHYFLEKCEFVRIFLWIIAKMGVFLFWKNAEHVGKKNFALY